MFKQTMDDNDGLDFTWWYPQVLLFSCLEIDFAIMCASMPIFWPTMVASLSQIFVTKEVHVTHQRLDEDSWGDNYEMETQGSMKSKSSQEGLTKHNASYSNLDPELGRGKHAKVAQVEVQQSSQRIHIDTFP